MNPHADVATMAAVLATWPGLDLADEGECILVLYRSSYAPFDILHAIDEARETAYAIRVTMLEGEAERLATKEVERCCGTD